MTHKKAKINLMNWGAVDIIKTAYCRPELMKLIFAVLYVIIKRKVFTFILVVNDQTSLWLWYNKLLFQAKKIVPSFTVC